MTFQKNMKNLLSNKNKKKYILKPPELTLFYKLYFQFKQGRKRPLDTSKRMIERREREKER